MRTRSWSNRMDVDRRAERRAETVGAPAAVFAEEVEEEKRDEEEEEEEEYARHSRWWLRPSASCAIVVHQREPLSTAELAGVLDRLAPGEVCGGVAAAVAAMERRSRGGREGGGGEEHGRIRKAARSRRADEEQRHCPAPGNSEGAAAGGEEEPICNLPDHLIESVVARLPVQCVFRMRVVSRAWNALLHSRTFLRAYDEAAAAAAWFLVPNLGRLGRDGQRIVATYDPRDDAWLGIPLPAPLRDLNPYPTAADGGLVCYFVYENRLRTLFICNPLTKSLRKLPQVLKASSHISVLKMFVEDRAACRYKVFVAGMVPNENGGDSLILEVYDSASNSWSAGGVIPARYPKRRPVFGNGVLYVRCYDQRSLLLTYDLRRNLWSRHHAPLPHTLGYEELVQYCGRVLLVGVLEENYVIRSVCIWELLPQSRGNLAWKQVGCMPRDLFEEFFSDRDFFQCRDEERVIMKCCHYGDWIICVSFNVGHRGPFKLLAYDLVRKAWVKMPDEFKAGHCRTHKFIEGVIFEPRLDAYA